MQAQIDKFGRVVIPKVIRDHLGIANGSILIIEERNQDIVLTLVNNTPKIKVDGGVTVYTAQATDNLEMSVQNEREQRLKRLGGM